MANIDPNNVLAQLTAALRLETEDVSGRGVGTRLTRAIQNNIAVTGTIAGIRERNAFNREAEILQLRQQMEQQAAQAEAQAQQQQQVQAVLAQADSNFLAGRSEEERTSLQGTAFERAFREKELDGIISDLSSRDMLEEGNLQALGSAQIAKQLAVAERQQSGLDDASFNEFKQGINFDEVYENRNDSDFGPIDFVRNAVGSAVGGITGLADLGLSAVGLGAVGEPIGELGQGLANFIDEESLGSAIFGQRLANAPADQGFGDAARGALDALNPGAVAGLGADLVGLIGAGGPISAGVRASGRALGAGANTAAVGNFLARGGTPALAAGAGLDFADRGIEGDNSARTLQALTQLAGTVGLGALAAAPGIGQLVGGVERAAAQGGVRGVLGGQLPARATTGNGTIGGTVRNLAGDAGSRVLAGGVSGLRQAGSEGAQETLEELISQTALGVGQGDIQYDPGALGTSAALGAALGGGIGSGRALQTRERVPSQPTVDATPTADQASGTANAQTLALPLLSSEVGGPTQATQIPAPSAFDLGSGQQAPVSGLDPNFINQAPDIQLGDFPIAPAQNTQPSFQQFGTAGNGTIPQLNPPALQGTVQGADPVVAQPQQGLNAPIEGEFTVLPDDAFLDVDAAPLPRTAAQIEQQRAVATAPAQLPAGNTVPRVDAPGTFDITGLTPQQQTQLLQSRERFAGTEADNDVAVTEAQPELPVGVPPVELDPVGPAPVQVERLAMVKRGDEVYNNGTLRGTPLLIGTQDVATTGVETAPVPGLANRTGRGAGGSASFRIGLIDPSNPGVFAYEPEGSTRISGPTLLRNINRQITEGRIDPDLTEVFARANNPTPGQVNTPAELAAPLAGTDALTQTEQDAGVGPVGPFVSEQQVLDSERVTIDSLYASIENREIPKALRQAEALVRDGEYTIDDMLDAALSTDNPQIQQRFTARIEQLGNQLAAEDSRTYAQGGLAESNRVSPEILQRRRAGIESEIEASQQAGLFNEVPALQEELNAINETLEGQALLDQETLNQIVRDESIPNPGGGRLGEPRPAGLRESLDQAGRAAPADRVIDRSGPDGQVRASRTSPSPRLRSASAPIQNETREGQSRPATSTSSNASAAPPRLGAGSIRARLSKLLGTFPYEVVNSSSDLTPEFRQKLVEDTGYDWDDGIKAVIYGNTVYINANNISDQTDLDVTMMHEIMGHAGLRARYGPKLDGALNDVVSSYGGLNAMLRAADRMGMSELRTDYAEMIRRAEAEGPFGISSRVIAEEIIAKMVERGPMDARRATIIERMGAAVKQWMRSKFPKVAEFLSLGMADWELGVMASEASYAGRKLLDGAQPIDTVRAYAARRQPMAEQIRNYATENGRAARNAASSVIGGNAPLNQRFAGTLDNVRNSGRDAREAGALRSEENFYNKVVRKLVNNRRPLQNTTRQIRRALAGDARLVQKAVDGIFNASTAAGIRVGKDPDGKRLGIVNQFFQDALGPGLDPEARAEMLVDKLALYERIQLSESQAETQHQKATKELDGELKQGFSVLSQAMPGGPTGRVSQREAFELYDGNRRNLHAVERNEAFFFDYTKNKAVRKFITPAAFDAVKALRKRTLEKGSGALSPAESFRQEKAVILAGLKENIQEDFDTARYETTQTTGPDSSTNAARARMAEDAITPAEQVAMDMLDATLDKYIALDMEVRKSYGGYSQNYIDAIDRYNFQYYSPQWIKDEQHDNTFDIGQGVFDSMMSTHEAAQGTQLETQSPVAAITTMVGRTFHDRADNNVKKDVIALWAAAQNGDVAGALGPEWADAKLTIIDKTFEAKKYDKLMASAQKNVFVAHLNDVSPELAAATGRGELNSALDGSASNFALVLEYAAGKKAKGKGAQAKSPIPELVKGVRERNSIVTSLRESDNMAINALTGSASLMGKMHTKYDPAWPVIQLLRDTFAAFVTVGATEGVAGIKDFTNEGLGSVMHIAPKMSQYMYHLERDGADSAAKIRALDNDPELKEFLDFINEGAPSPFARSVSLDSRMDDFADSLRSRGLTPDELNKLSDVDQVISMFSSMTDVVGRYATYKAFRARGYSKQQAASEARGIADFAQRGQSQYAEMGAMGYMFFRSGVIGATQIIDTLIDSRYGPETLALATGISAGMFSLAAMMSPEDDEGNNLFLTQGNSTTHFKVFIDADTVVQIPYSYNGFVAAGAATVQALYGLTGNQSMASTASNIADVVINNVTPVSNKIGITDEQGDVDLTQVSKKLFDLASPTLANPFLGMAMNVNNFGNRIVPEGGSVSDPGTIGASLDSSGSQIGTAAEVIARTISDSTGISPSVRQLSYLMNEMANGPTAIADSALEWFRLATGREYKANWKQAALPLAGVIGTPYNSQSERYYELWNKLSDIDRSRRTLERSGLTPDEAEEEILRAVGPEVLSDVVRFDGLNDELLTPATELKNIRLSQTLTSAERLNEYREKTREQNARIGALVRSFDGDY